MEFNLRPLFALPPNHILITTVYLRHVYDGLFCHFPFTNLYYGMPNSYLSQEAVTFHLRLDMFKVYFKTNYMAF